MPKPKRKLTELFLHEVSFVDAGDNPEAHILLVKNKDSGDESEEAGDAGATDEGVNMSAINKALGLPETATEAEALAEIAKRATATDVLTKALEKSEADAKSAKEEVEKVEKARKAEAADESFVSTEGAVIKKSAVGGSYEILKSMNDRLETAEIEKSLKVDYPNLDATEATGLVRLAKRSNEEDRKTLETVLKAYNDVLGASFTQQGLRKAKPACSDDPEAELQKMADDMALEKGITSAAAYDAITKTAKGQELVRKSRAH